MLNYSLVNLNADIVLDQNGRWESADGSRTYIMSWDEEPLSGWSMDLDKDGNDAVAFKVNDNTLQYIVYGSFGIEDSHIKWDEIDISLDDSTIAENTEGPQHIANITGTFIAWDEYDPEVDNLTYTITGGPDASMFEIVGSMLHLATGVSADYETKNQLVVELTATNSMGFYYSEDFTVNVTDVVDSLTGTSQHDQFDGLSGVLEINGLSGIDAVNYDLSTQEITFTSNDNQIVIRDSDYRQETLYNIERINFTDKSYALDLDGNAGIAAKIIIATFGSDSLNTYMSAALSLVDTGSSLDSLCDLVIQNGFIENAIGSTDITDFVTEIYTNAMGRVPTSLESAILTGYSDKGTHTKTDLLKLAANSSQVESQITENSVDLIGVAGNTDGEMLALLI